MFGITNWKLKKKKHFLIWQILFIIHNYMLGIKILIFLFFKMVAGIKIYMIKNIF